MGNFRRWQRVITSPRTASEIFERLIEAGNQAYDAAHPGKQQQNPAAQDEAASASASRSASHAPEDEENDHFYRAIACYEEAVRLYHGDFLPERRYEDWTGAVRERLQVLALKTMTTLAEMIFATNLLESLRLTQRVLTIDPVWEDAYRVQMRAFAAQGNRPMALRTYARCVENLEKEFGVEPLPETRTLYEDIRRGKF